MTASVPDSRLVIWPETAVPAFATEVETSLLAPLDSLLREQGRTCCWVSSTAANPVTITTRC